MKRKFHFDRKKASFEERKKLKFGLGLKWVIGLLVLGLLSCAPTLYSVQMHYEPKNGARPAGERGAFVVSVANFEDLRPVADKMKIGKVVTSRGEEIPIFPKYQKPTQAVSSGLRRCLAHAGYTVSAEQPSWDLKEADIHKDWGRILVGGSIDELQLTCEESLTVKKYEASVKLTVLFADVRNGRIFYRTTASSSTSLDHVLFSEEKLEQQINSALSDAIEKAFEGKEINTKIMDVVKEQP